MGKLVIGWLVDQSTISYRFVVVVFVEQKQHSF